MVDAYLILAEEARRAGSAHSEASNPTLVIRHEVPELQFNDGQAEAGNSEHDGSSQAPVIARTSQQ